MAEPPSSAMSSQQHVTQIRTTSTEISTKRQYSSTGKMLDPANLNGGNQPVGQNENDVNPEINPSGPAKGPRVVVVGEDWKSARPAGMAQNSAGVYAITMPPQSSILEDGAVPWLDDLQEVSLHHRRWLSWNFEVRSILSDETALTFIRKKTRTNTAYHIYEGDTKEQVAFTYVDPSSCCNLSRNAIRRIHCPPDTQVVWAIMDTGRYYEAHTTGPDGTDTTLFRHYLTRCCNNAGPQQVMDTLGRHLADIRTRLCCPGCHKGSATMNVTFGAGISAIEKLAILDMCTCLMERSTSSPRACQVYWLMCFSWLIIGLPLTLLGMFILGVGF